MPYNFASTKTLLRLIIPVSSSLVLFISPVLENLSELVVVKHPLGDGGLLVHLVHLVIREPVPDGGQELPQLVLVQGSHHVLVKTSKRILNHLLRVGSLKGVT